MLALLRALGQPRSAITTMTMKITAATISLFILPIQKGNLGSTYIIHLVLVAFFDMVDSLSSIFLQCTL